MCSSDLEESTLDAYAAAWALTRHLMETRKPQFVEYLRLQATKQPLEEDTTAGRLDDFGRIFGTTAEAIEQEVVKSAARLQTRLRGR